jgi:hypothetical protein
MCSHFFAVRMHFIGLRSSVFDEYEKTSHGELTASILKAPRPELSAYPALGVIPEYNCIQVCCCSEETRISCSSHPDRKCAERLS